MLNTCDQSLICWSNDGDSFIVRSPEKFAEQEIPKFFKHSKFKSFTRQLNFYGFHKLPDDIRNGGQTIHRWHHENFRRDYPARMKLIVRKGKKNKDVVKLTKKQVETLTDKVAELEATIKRLKAAMQTGCPSSYGSNGQAPELVGSSQTEVSTQVLKGVLNELAPATVPDSIHDSHVVGKMSPNVQHFMDFENSAQESSGGNIINVFGHDMCNISPYALDQSDTQHSGRNHLQDDSPNSAFLFDLFEFDLEPFDGDSTGGEIGSGGIPFEW